MPEKSCVELLAGNSPELAERTGPDAAKRPVIAIVNGSPHSGGYTSQLVERVTAGVEDAGGTADVLRLVEFRIAPCVNTPGWPCWPDGRCHHVEDDTSLARERVQRADGLVVACPVYWSDINGLTKTFLDKMRLSGFEGKPALGITMAGGSGNGMVLALRSLHGFFGWGYRPLPPLPVCRFNFTQALETAYQRGHEMATAARCPRPFANWAEQLRWERSLPFADWCILDEKLYLAGLLIENAPAPPDSHDSKEAQKLLAHARQLIDNHGIDQAIEDIALAVEKGRTLWKMNVPLSAQ
ncbi:MAG TPA: flavodoxin family protein [Levilinea sp.]|nr:flavodoxin family protein [Levilinea sp.]